MMNLGTTYQIRSFGRVGRGNLQLPIGRTNSHRTRPDGLGWSEAGSYLGIVDLAFQCTSAIWSWSNGGINMTDPLPMYALSSVITVPVPEPTTLPLLGSALFFASLSRSYGGDNAACLPSSCHADIAYG